MMTMPVVTMTPPMEEAHDVSLTELLPELLKKIAEHLAADEDVLQPRGKHWACPPFIADSALTAST